MPLDEVDGPISSGQAAVSGLPSLYENIDAEVTTTMDAGQDTDHLTVLHPESQTSSTIDSLSLCPLQQIPAIDNRYENARTCHGTQPFQAILPASASEFQSTGENYTPDQNGDTPQENSAVEAVSYIRVVSQVRMPDPYESLQSCTASDPI